MTFSEKVAFLFPGDELQRVSISESPSGDLAVSLDVHGMKCWQAKRSITNLINIARRPFTLTVIHGYNHGTAIQDMVRRKLTNDHIRGCHTDNYNQGITYLAIA